MAADRGEIIPRENLAILAQWKVDDIVLAALEGTGFNYLYDLAVKVGRNQHVNGMIDALVKHYDKNDMCLKVQDQHLFFGLEDVVFISGLKVEGKLLTKGGIEEAIQVSRVQDEKGNRYVEFLGNVPSKYMKEGGKAITFEGLQRTFEKVPRDVSEETFARHVRAFALYVANTTITVTTENKYESVACLKAFSDIYQIKNFAWGVAMLSQVHYSLMKYETKKGANIGGHMYFLMVWVLEHFPAFRDSLGVLVPAQCNFSLACSWTSPLSEKLANRNRHQSYSQLLDQHCEVDWNPYSRLGDTFLPEGISNQQRMRAYRGVLVNAFHK